MFRRPILFLVLSVMFVTCGTITARTQEIDCKVTDVFVDDDILFNADHSFEKIRHGVAVSDNGRQIQTKVQLPTHNDGMQILVHLMVKPVPKDELTVYDRWDRAGNIRLVSEGMPDLELIKFVTSYGGLTDWTVDISHLAPVLRGEVTVAAMIDTWVNPAWKISLSFECRPGDNLPRYEWVKPVFYENSFDLEKYADTGATVSCRIDGNQQRVKLYYLVSGHCTDGRDADEFVKKDNVIAVDDQVVYRYQPWRDDCRKFRDLNPYTKHWTDGYWSSDYSRSGWCPGDVVEPLTLDLTDHLKSGDHRFKFRIESIRPRGADGHFGYWRVSAYLVGLSDPE